MVQSMRSLLLLPLLSSLAFASPYPQGSAQQPNNTALTTTNNNTLGEPLIRQPNIKVAPVLNPTGPKPVRMQRGQSAYALLVCASKTWRMPQSKVLPDDARVRDDFFPQNITFKLYSRRTLATTQEAGWACILMLEDLIRTSAANPDNEFWIVPSYHMFYGAIEQAYGRMRLDSGNLPRQLGAESAGLVGGENGTSTSTAVASSTIAMAVGTAAPLRYPSIYGAGTVQPFRRLAKRSDSGNEGDDEQSDSTDVVADLTDDEPASTEIQFTQSFNRQWLSARSVVQLLLEYLKAIPWQQHPDDPIAELYSGGEIWDSQSIGLGQRLQVEVLQVAVGEQNVMWRDVGEFVRRLLIEPTVTRKWKGWTAEVTFKGQKEPWMRVKAFVGRVAGVEEGDGETGVQTALAASA